MNIENIQERIIDGTSDVCGHSADYIKINDSLGVKYYESVILDLSDDLDVKEMESFKFRCYNAYCLSKYMHEIGIGPKVHGYTVFETNKNVREGQVRVYCMFFTRHAELLPNNHIDFVEYREIAEIAHENGLCFRDTHACNLGVIDGEIVVIDPGCVCIDGVYHDNMTAVCSIENLMFDEEECKWTWEEKYIDEHNLDTWDSI